MTPLPPIGLEPMTARLKVGCSTTELRGRIVTFDSSSSCNLGYHTVFYQHVKGKNEKTLVVVKEGEDKATTRASQDHFNIKGAICQS